MSTDIQRPFPASYRGHCKGCGMPYQPSDMIVSPGKGKGAFHPRCFKARKQGLFAQQAARREQEAKET